MVVVEIGNLYTTVVGLKDTVAIFNLENALSVDTPGASFSASYRAGMWDGKTKFARKSKGGIKFPTGLLTNAMKSLKMRGIKYELVDIRTEMEVTVPSEIKLADPKLGHITLRDYQQEAVEKSLKATRGVVNVATNGGKTEIACGIMKIVRNSLGEGQRIVFFTHSKEIFKQSVKRLEKRLGQKVGVIGNGKWEEEQITVVMIPTITQYLKEPKQPKKTKKMTDYDKALKNYQTRIRNGETDLKEEAKQVRLEFAEYKAEQLEKAMEKHKMTKKFLKSVVCFIADECHHASSDTWYKLFMELDNAYFRFGLTGTVDEDQPINLMRLFGSTGRITKKVSNAFLIEHGYSAKPTINMISYKAPSIVSSYDVARYDGIICNEHRNHAFLHYIQEERKQGNQCLIIVNETEHGDIVGKMLSDSKIDHKFTHGDRADKFREKVLEDFSEGKIHTLIATSVLDEGVDISNIDAIFLMSGGKSMRMALQRIGRGLRKKDDGRGVNIYDGLDYHNDYLADHTMERYNVYKEEQFEIKKVGVK